MKYLLLAWVVLNSLLSFAQTRKINRDTLELYKDYREDQFYASVTYNILNFKSEAISQTGFSPGFHFGFIRDMPINKRRNVAIGLGLGLSINSYNQNLTILENNNKINFTVVDQSQTNVTTNRFSTYLIEAPLELRWRTSTAVDYSFWRIYAGIKFGYMLTNTTRFSSDSGDTRLSNLDVFNRFQYGLTLSAGLNTWNIHLYYGLHPLFNRDSELNSEGIDLATMNLGLIFYIL